MRTRTPDARADFPASAAPTPPIDLRRRGFLLAVGAGGAGAAATAVAALPGVQTAPSTDAQGEGSGYRETQHVRDYYRTAKI